MNTARTILALFAAVGIGLIGYQIGVGTTVAGQMPGAMTPMAAYAYPHLWGFGFFGLLVPLFFFLLFFGMLRAAVGGGRGWGGHHWEGRRARFEELHRELHGEKTPSAGDPHA